MWIKIIKRTLFFFIILVLSVNIILIPYLTVPCNKIDSQNNICVIQNTISKKQGANDRIQSYYCNTKQKLYHDCSRPGKVPQGTLHGIAPRILKCQTVNRADQKNKASPHYMLYTSIQFGKVPHSINNSVAIQLTANPLYDIHDGAEPNRPPNLSPPGSGRRGALREAKRRNSIPACEQPSAVLPNYDRRGKARPGRTYVYGDKHIRDDIHGHQYQDNPSQNRGPHFNDDQGRHFDYEPKVRSYTP